MCRITTQSSGPFDASILLSIDPEPIDIAQGRWVDSLCSLRAAELGRFVCRKSPATGKITGIFIQEYGSNRLGQKEEGWPVSRNTHMIKANSYRSSSTGKYFQEHSNTRSVILSTNEVDLSVFEERYRNDETGAPAYDPATLLKIILFAYSRGFVSSRQIAQCCRKNIIFMALSADTRPHFTTIAEFLWSVAVGGALLAVSLSHTLWWIRSGMVLIGLSAGFYPVA